MTAALRPESAPLIFQLKRKFIPEDGHQRWARCLLDIRSRQGGWRALVPSGRLVAPVWYFFAHFLFQNKFP